MEKINLSKLQLLDFGTPFELVRELEPIIESERAKIIETKSTEYDNEFTSYQESQPPYFEKGSGNKYIDPTLPGYDLNL